ARAAGVIAPVEFADRLRLRRLELQRCRVSVDRDRDALAPLVMRRWRQFQPARPAAAVELAPPRLLEQRAQHRRGIGRPRGQARAKVRARVGWIRALPQRAHACSRVSRTRSGRLRTPSLVIMFALCSSTVLMLMPSSSATILLSFPATTSSITWRSR